MKPANDCETFNDSIYLYTNIFSFPVSPTIPQITPRLSIANNTNVPISANVSQFAIRFPSISNDPYFHLSATFLFPNGNEERLNVGDKEYVLPPWFDKELFSSLSEPFERKRLDLIR
ncbi:hypothetical protein CEXT_422711 [Caerostris extrusa]|uniref:Uncharacterized protein n=1 Tax=Caerostris extrusa TaxID=172846 RepID=A0AAV4Y2N8_CAEEX|nr:hypothetical protein CEXT_422711 [Caerostris extrusa]